jgi:hypothetical protein
MTGLLEVLCGVTARRGVATGNIAADEAHAELNRALAGLGALLTGLAARLDLVIDKV